jgi:hypothetical protein
VTAPTDEELRLDAERVARQRARKRRDVLASRVEVLDEIYAAEELELPACPTIAEVAAFFGIDRGPLTTLVRHYGEELRRDGWRPRHPRRPGCDLWTEEAVIRAALLLDRAVGCKSAVAEQVRYHLGYGALPLVFSTTDARLAQCARLFGRALALVGDVHGEAAPEQLWRDLQDTCRYELQCLVVALAAMVPDDQPGLAGFLCEVSARPGRGGSRERGLALLIPRRAKLLRRRRRPGSEPEACEPGGVAVAAER